VYTTEQRLDQTLTSITSIRKHIPDAKILLIDGTPSTRQIPHALSRLRDKVDFLCCPENPEYFVDHAYKGLGEMWLLRQGIQYLRENHPSLLPTAQAIFKLSGRYRLHDQFDPTPFLQAKGKNVFRRIEQGSVFDEKIPCLYTMLFKIDPDQISTFENYLQNGLTNEIRESVERYMFLCYQTDPNTLLMESTPLGIEGNISVCGRKVRK